MIETKKKPEQVLLIAVCDGDEGQVNTSLDELEELVKTAGAETVGRVIQNREQVHPGTYVGKGKLEEIKYMILMTEATGIVCDDELSPAQIKNLENELDTKIMDRTLIILDIFAARANTSEGKIQVEMAQLKYRLSRLTGLGRSLSRLGGGIGTRGPGEKKLEIDRRRINARCAQLRRELEDVEKHREITRAQRNRSNIKVAAIVGYTNAGKSTLLNTLTDASVLEEDKLFATLDPTTRMLELGGKQQILLTDTVGFIRKLPHNLIDAFKSTLEEAKYADIIIHVVDSSNPDWEAQMKTCYDTLDELEVKGKTIITCFNKCDKFRDPEAVFRDFRAKKVLHISAKNGDGLDRLKDSLEQALREGKQLVKRIYSYDEAGKIQEIRKYGELIKEEYIEEGIYVEAWI